MDNVKFDVQAAVVNEMHRQDAKWGPQSHGHERWLSILTEEVGEVAKAINAVTFDGAKPEDLAHVETELIQVAAVAIQAATDLRRKRESTLPFSKPSSGSHDVCKSNGCPGPKDNFICPMTGEQRCPGE